MLLALKFRSMKANPFFPYFAFNSRMGLSSKSRDTPTVDFDAF